MIIGTAGHIDHGKSMLVEALTGQPMDRLAEERRRGITIDLNFAPLDLGDGEIAGIVDVPGHEDFVRTMVAGAAGIDLVLLVVAADEGIMPQTLEHLLVVEQLGVERGIAAVTKVDLVEREWAELVAADLAERLEKSPVAFGPPLLVSPKRGDGMDRLTRAIREAAGEVAVVRDDDAFRMPVDRAFSLPGVGTVVTGTIWSGRLAVGDQVRVMPAGLAARVRSIEHHGRAVDETMPRSRTAIGLAGVDRSDIRRGATVVTDALPWRETTAVDVYLALSAAAPRAIAARTRVRIHLGTQEVLGRVHPREPLEPGRSVLARLALEATVVARGGDRFVMRSYSPVSTIGGGWIVDPLPLGRRSTWPQSLASSDPSARLGSLVGRRPRGVAHGELPVLLGLSPAVAGQVADEHTALVRAGEYWVERAAVELALGRAQGQVDGYHRQNPAEVGIPLQALKARLSPAPWIADLVVERLAADGAVELVDGRVRVPGFEPRVEGGQEEIERVVAELEAEGLTPPSVSELARRVGRSDVGDTLRLAARQGRAVMVSRDRYFASRAVEGFVATLTEVGAGGDITVAALRDRLGLTRKWLIPLLEWADGQGVTMRVGDIRRLVDRAGPA